MPENATQAEAQDAATCLIVEDSQFDSEKMTRVVNRVQRKMKIEVAASLKSAREALARGQMSLILLDNNLPDGLGANFALELAKDVRLSEIPVIMVSDWPSPFMWEKAASAGVIYVVSKTEFDGRYVQAALSNARQKKAKMN